MTSTLLSDAATSQIRLDVEQTLWMNAEKANSFDNRTQSNFSVLRIREADEDCARFCCGFCILPAALVLVILHFGFKAF